MKSYVCKREAPLCRGREMCWVQPGDPLPSNVQLWIRSFALEHRNMDFCSCFYGSTWMGVGRVVLVIFPRFA